jgi:hypothetical protein
VVSDSDQAPNDDRHAGWLPITNDDTGDNEKVPLAVRLPGCRGSCLLGPCEHERQLHAFCARPEQATVAGDVPSVARRRQDPPQQRLVGLEDQPPVRSSGSSIAPAARKPFPATKTASAWASTCCSIQSMTLLRLLVEPWRVHQLNLPDPVRAQRRSGLEGHRARSSAADSLEARSSE